MEMSFKSIFFLVCFLSVIGSLAQAAVIEHTFNVGNLTVRKLCKTTVVTAVNGKLPGPTIRAHEGDDLIIHVLNKSPNKITIHWHGIFQLLSQWADGPSYITQCPIVPGGSYTYKFRVVEQEGTLWWHAHSSILRATVYGALIIRPRAGTKAYPFPIPYKEVPILLGEWWNANVVDVEREAQLSGNLPNASDALMINGRPGDLYGCSNKHTYKLRVVHGKTYLLRIISAALDEHLFFKIAGHTFTVVAADASYTAPYATDLVVIAPGQTVDVLMTADASPSRRYYIAARPYISAPSTVDNTTTTAILQYESPPLTDPPVMPALPEFNDTPAAHRFYTSLISRKTNAVPIDVDHRMFVTIGLGLTPCAPDQTRCKGFAALTTMNNVSFQFPKEMSILEAHFRRAEGVYTPDFPDFPSVVFDYTNASLALAIPLLMAEKGTRVRRVSYNSTVEVVLQNTALLSVENHPMHLHGFNFFVLAQGFGNYEEAAAIPSYNLVDPQERNTIAVPVGGWAVIRFRANNPGVWFFHCHLDRHMSTGLATAFEVENGPTASSTLPPPPLDYPRC